MHWRSIRLELGSTGDFPAGSVSRAYLLRLPLNDCDVIDRGALHDNPSRATVRRHWATEPDERGLLTRSDDNWAMRCDGRAERVFQLDGMPVRLGGRVSVMEPDGTILPFKIASIR